MVLPEPDGEKGSLLILWWDSGADEGFAQKCAPARVMFIPLGGQQVDQTLRIF
ncbi:hypothetical protein [Methanoculleus formosensis]|uniref:hypothetical protein n=1 Tax=Methanoculleus formosensis TaxID=2590886 RepID=UPI0021C12799|nr:hypothetical protein [Methanoculleus sp. Afa-1]